MGKMFHAYGPRVIAIEREREREKEREKADLKRTDYFGAGEVRYPMRNGALGVQTFDFSHISAGGVRRL